MFVRFFTIALALCTVSAFAESSSGDQDGGHEAKWPHIKADVDFMSQYVWRGQVHTDGPVMQPALGVGYKGFHFHLWSNVDLNDVNHAPRKFTAVEYSGSYERAVGPLALSGGVIHYTYPNRHEHPTTELHTGARWRTLLNPSVTAYFDVQDIDGTYISGDVQQTIPLPRLGDHVVWALDFKFGLGWGSKGFNEGYFHAHHSGIVDYHPEISLPITIAHRITLAPRVGYSTLVSKELRFSKVLHSPHAHNFFGGVRVTWENH